MSPTEFARDHVAPKLRLAYSNSKAPIKEIARAADVNYETAKAWFNGRAVPQALHWERLKAVVPGLDAAVRELHALEADMDPEAQRLATQLVQHLMKAKTA